MRIYEDSTRFVFEDYTEKDLQILRRLVSADGKSFLYECDDYVACPIGIEKYIHRKFPDIKIEKRNPWESVKMKYIPSKYPDPRNRLQKDALKFLRENKNRNQLGLICGVGTGKAQPYSSNIPTPKGVIKMGDLMVGDKVFTQDGTPTTVLEIYEQGKKDVYRISFDDGRSCECTYDHLWEVYRFDPDDPIHQNLQVKTMSTREITHWMTDNVYIQTCDPVEFDKKHQFSLDTYVHGIMVSHNTVSTSDADGTIVLTNITDQIETELLCCGVQLQKIYGKTYFVTNRAGSKLMCGEAYDELLDPLILDKISMSSIHQRERFMCGVLKDHTAIVSTNGIENMVYHHDNEKILNKIQYIGYSLGWKINRIDSHRISIVIPHVNHVETSMLQIVKIEKLHGQQKCRCIRVSDPSHLYLTEDFIVTHNTYMSINHAIKVGEKTLIICPTTAILEQWVKTLKNMFNVPENRIYRVIGTSGLRHMKDDHDWVLVLEQTLQTAVRDKTLEELLFDAKFGLKITDEVHMFLRNNISIDCSTNIERSLYCTGTFFRTDEEESNLFNAVYHNILRFEVVDQKELERYGQKKHIEVYSVVINSRLTRREVNHIVIHAKIGRKTVPTVSVGRYMDIVCPRDGRITEYMKQSLSVIRRMRDRVPYGRMLVLVPSIYATKQFRQLIAEMFPKLKVGCINSDQSRLLNNNVKEEADIIVSTSKSSGVGFDMDDLSILIAVEQFRSSVLVEQISGRLRPRKDGKHTYYVDIADSALGSYLLRWRSDRLERLKKKAVSYQQFRVSGDK